MTFDQATPEDRLWHSVFDSRRTTFARCFSPNGDCRNPAVRAHSIQNARALSLLAEGGHVVMPQSRMEPDGPKVEFRRVGRSVASTFTGLCSDHDQQIFAPLETKVFDLQSAEQRFLLAYRALLKELHAKCQAAVRIAQVYSRKVELGLDPGDQPTEAAVSSFSHDVWAWELWKYKLMFDEMLLHREFGCLEHDLLRLETERPTVAACVLFSVNEAESRAKVVVSRVAFNVMPLGPETVVLFSYAPGDAAAARKRLARVLDSRGLHSRRSVSRLILSHAENFVLAPSFVDGWSPAKRDSILNYFQDTVWSDDVVVDEASLDLF